MSWRKYSSGRVISMLIHYFGCQINLLGIYAPTNPAESKSFFENLHEFFIPASYHNVCTNMAARFLLTFRSFILILGLCTGLLQKQDIDSVYNNLSRHGRCKWQGFYDLRSIFGHLYYMNF